MEVMELAAETNQLQGREEKRKDTSPPSHHVGHVGLPAQGRSILHLTENRFY